MLMKTQSYLRLRYLRLSASGTALPPRYFSPETPLHSVFLPHADIGMCPAVQR